MSELTTPPEEQTPARPFLKKFLNNLRNSSAFVKINFGEREYNFGTEPKFDAARDLALAKEIEDARFWRRFIGFTLGGIAVTCLLILFNKR